MKKKGKHKRILWVDDEIWFMDGQRLFLEEEGFEVHQAHNEDEAITALGKNAYDLILLDIMLPSNQPQKTHHGKRTGVSLAEHIRNNFGKNVPIIVYTVIGDRPVIEELNQLGNLRYLIKPCSASELLTAIRECLN